MNINIDDASNGAILIKPYERPGSYLFFKAIRKNKF